MELSEFMSKFNFREEGKLLVGIERECHLVDGEGVIVPRAQRVLELIADNKHFGYELSACQLESRTDPVELLSLKDALMRNENIALSSTNTLALECSHKEVAPFDMPLDVYPDPTGRYQEIVKTLPEDVLRAACRVIGTHVHIGMPDHETALRVYNHAISFTDELSTLGDGSDGERLKIYRIMAPDALPPAYASWNEFYSVAQAKGFDKDPRKCWTLIRISVHGTIEFRMFGTTGDLDTIVAWASSCWNICASAIDTQVAKESRRFG